MFFLCSHYVFIESVYNFKYVSARTHVLINPMWNNSGPFFVCVSSVFPYQWRVENPQHTAYYHMNITACPEFVIWRIRDIFISMHRVSLSRDNKRSNHIKNNSFITCIFLISTRRIFVPCLLQPFSPRRYVQYVNYYKDYDDVLLLKFKLLNSFFKWLYLFKAGYLRVNNFDYLK